ncbi:MAG: AAA family ATPase, partial [Actinobacteria bacterium]|nr:AAA family ATPase [Actinomycetota bacterium]
MTIEDDVREWAATRPLWQQEVLAELADGREFTDADLESLADRVAAATGTATAAGSSTLSIRHGTADQVQLVELGSLNCVNALIDGETLTFGGDGLTIIYGDNGSGKSGYARLLKNMIKTRHEEVVLANVFEDGGDTPSAELVYTISGSRE